MSEEINTQNLDFIEQLYAAYLENPDQLSEESAALIFRVGPGPAAATATASSASGRRSGRRASSIPRCPLKWSTRGKSSRPSSCSNGSINWFGIIASRGTCSRRSIPWGSTTGRTFLNWRRSFSLSRRPTWPRSCRSTRYRTAISGRSAIYSQRCAN